MAPTVSITTPLPAELSEAALIKVLHDHDVYIKTTCPQLVSYELESGDAAALGTPVVYKVTDKKPLGQVTYKLTLTNTADGISGLVNAKPPIGALNITSVWKVAEGKLAEETDIDANIVMKKMVKGNVEKSHGEFHQEFIKLAGAA
jgi:hypothetical protein